MPHAPRLARQYVTLTPPLSLMERGKKVMECVLARAHPARSYSTVTLATP